jgi:predicted DNA-binding WGR domain protein
MNGAAAQHPHMIELIALDPVRNIRRRYAIMASIDLFGAILVETRWGRIGTRGQAKRLAFEDQGMADRYIAATLRRRSTSTARIGVAYRRVETGAMP